VDDEEPRLDAADIALRVIAWVSMALVPLCAGIGGFLYSPAAGFGALAAAFAFVCWIVGRE
jgi:hypothetical protein